MIKNEKQYKISKKRIEEMESILSAKKSGVLPGSKEDGALNSIMHMKNNIAGEIMQYENLRNNKLPLRKKISLFQLPQILIEHKIAKGLTQKEFSKILGIKEQQLQRYEADNYQSVSFGRLLEYIEKANIKINMSVQES